MAEPGKKPIYKKWWFWVLLVLVLGVIGAASSKDNVPAPTENPSQQKAVSNCVPVDDLTTFTCRYGKPDVDYNSASETPQPIVITRMLTYTKENVRAIYVPQTKSPPYEKWNLVAFQDPTTKKALTPEEVVLRMKLRDTNK